MIPHASRSPFARAIAAGLAALLGAATLTVVAVAAPELPAAIAAPTNPTVTCTTDPDIFNTGVTEALNGRLSPGTSDRNWEVSGPYGSVPSNFNSLGVTWATVASVTGWGIQAPPATGGQPWASAIVGEGASVWVDSPYLNAQWITQRGPNLTQANASDGRSGASWYYRYNFVLDSAINVDEYALELDFFADNSVAEVFVNGTPQSPSNPLTLPQSFTSENRPLDYRGYEAGRGSRVILADGWVAGSNSIVVQIYSGPGYEGFNTQAVSTVTCINAVDDAQTIAAGTTATTDVLANDTTATGQPLNPASVQIVTPPTTGTAVVQSDGTILYTPPTLTFAGSATYSYRVCDTSTVGPNAPYCDTATVTITVVSMPPAAAPDTVGTTQDATVTFNPLANDTIGSGGSAFVPTSVVLVALSSGGAVTDAGKTLTVPNEGAYTVLSDGRVTFDPLPAFTGPASQVGYSVTDAGSATVSSTINVTVTPVGPIANNDVLPSIGQNESITPFSPAANDQPGVVGGSAPIASSVILNQGTSVGGTFSVDAAGLVSFTAALGFVGTASIEYQVTDGNGLSAVAMITVPVSAVAPTLVRDTVSTDQDVTVSFDPLANDAPGNAASPLVASTVQLLALTSGGTVSNGGKSLTVPNEGTYTVAVGGATEGQVSFDPLPAFTGPAAQVGYSVADVNGTTRSTLIDATVAALPPIAVDDTVSPSIGQNESITPFSPAANDLPGVTGGSAPVASSVVLNQAGAVGGTFSVDSNGLVSFTAAVGFDGTASIEYTVADGNNLTDVGLISIPVVAAIPAAANDAVTIAQDVTVTVDVLDNDTAGNSASPLNPATVVLVAPSSGGTLSGDGKTLTIAGQGTYTVIVGGPNEGQITFDPAPSFTGPATAVEYSVTDRNSRTVSATLAVTVDAVGPVAEADGATIDQGTPVDILLLANDAPGVIDGTPLDRTSVELLDLTDPANPVWVTTLTVTAGVFEVDPATGVVTFTPTPIFVGVVPSVTYRVADTLGLTSESTITVTVERDLPSGLADTPNTSQGVAVSFSPLGNDAVGNANLPFDPSTLQFGILASGGTLSPDGKTLTVPGEGEYTVDAAGVVTFTPESTFSGVASPIGYRALDEGGNEVTSTITVTVVPATLVARDDWASAEAGKPVIMDPLINDTVGSGAPLDPTSVRLVLPSGVQGATLSADGKQLLLPREGTYEVDAVTGEVTYTSVSAMSGETTPVTYTVQDTIGVAVSAVITVTVTAAVFDLPTLALESLQSTGFATSIWLALAAMLILAGAALVVARTIRKA